VGAGATGAQEALLVYVAIGRSAPPWRRLSPRLYEESGHSLHNRRGGPPRTARFSSSRPCRDAHGGVFSRQARHAVFIYDDCTRRPLAYSLMSMLRAVRRGRVAIRADVFYLHSSCWRRAVPRSSTRTRSGLRSPRFPIVEESRAATSRTISDQVDLDHDGQILLESEKLSCFIQGHPPAVNPAFRCSALGSSRRPSDEVGRRPV
jgi:hypothetical protein